jgi:hypothetical protein
MDPPASAEDTHGGRYGMVLTAAFGMCPGKGDAVGPRRAHGHQPRAGRALC